MKATILKEDVAKALKAVEVDSRQYYTCCVIMQVCKRLKIPATGVGERWLYFGQTKGKRLSNSAARLAGVSHEKWAGFIGKKISLPEK